MTHGTIFFLGPSNSPVFEWLQKQANKPVLCFDTPISADDVRSAGCDCLVSFGYRHIIRKDILQAVGASRAINLHISLLPFNRGADPNLWSFLEDSPKGVTIHEMDEGVDTGPILCQREVVFVRETTLATTYARLQSEIFALFVDFWPRWIAGSIKAMAQDQGAGSLHRKKDKEPYLSLLSAGFDTPISSLVGKARVPRPR